MHFPSFLEDKLQKESEIIEISIESLKNMDYHTPCNYKTLFLLWYTRVDSRQIAIDW